MWYSVRIYSGKVKNGVFSPMYPFHSVLIYSGKVKNGVFSPMYPFHSVLIYSGKVKIANFSVRQEMIFPAYLVKETDRLLV